MLLVAACVLLAAWQPMHVGAVYQAAVDVTPTTLVPSVAGEGIVVLRGSGPNETASLMLRVGGGLVAARHTLIAYLAPTHAP